LQTTRILRWGVEALADDSPMGTVRYAAVLPLGLLQGAILDLCEHWQFVAFVHRHPDLRGSKSAVPARIDWPSLESDAASDAANRSSNNPFGLDGNYWLTNAARLQHTNDGPSGRKPLLVISLMVKGLRREPRNLEWQDFTLLIDRQNNLREGGGRQILLLAGQLLDQFFEPRIVPDDHHGLGVPHDLSEHREDVGRASHIKMPVQQDFSRKASRLGHGLSRQPCPHRVGADDQFGYQSVLP
jgi:hypothetical protein